MININTKKQITGVFVYIIGFLGSGKLSTAIELSNMIDALIVNSNFSNNIQIRSIYDNIFEHDQIPKEVQDRMYNIAQIMLQAIEAYPIHSKNYIFIDELMKNSDYNMKMYNSVVELSKRMNTIILPIVLKCDLPTLQKRIKLKRQRENKKVTSINSIIEKFRAHNLFIPPNAIEIENSNMSIREVAEEITRQIYRLSQIDRVYAKG
ncbi:AAA family ATPase [Wolbachia endosymbiont of Atemnus politus]|uniref:AAA family ATPase n=1 Tax=Wolbachia endosymbiont of Atemnus politus TaxID=2682840 RepID=UPI0015720EDB|nr:AAA family ATPase [Wolbachia endosymbiont of Atemnus politus]NSM56253.1 AAA family ATPase [Wolbachia endosymbiont of Atemnus politus]NSX83025.1 AAA family ATPase [Wolbachia endosymbiont of Atemnus politus]